MSASLQEYETLQSLEAALRRQVCSVCVDRNVDGSCDLDAHHECVLFDRLPQVAKTILLVQSGTIGDYMSAIRENICAQCSHQRLDGSCDKREEVRCALDRYLPLIVDVIEERRECFCETL